MIKRALFPEDIIPRDESIPPTGESLNEFALYSPVLPQAKYIVNNMVYKILYNQYLVINREV